VYGDPEQHPQKESYWGHVNPIGPRACYDEGGCFASVFQPLCVLSFVIVTLFLVGAGKRVAETMCYSYLQEGAVDVRDPPRRASLPFAV
jgi:UDP-glucuronate decarboxylase